MKQILIIMLFAGLCNAATPVAHFPLDDNEPNTTVINEYGDNGTLYGYDVNAISTLKITIDKDKVLGENTNYPVLINSLPDSFYTNVGDGSDIFLTLNDTGKTRLTYELVSLDKDLKTIELWVNLPTCSNTVDTEVMLNYGGDVDTLTFAWASDFHFCTADVAYGRYWNQIISVKFPAIQAAFDGSLYMLSGDLIQDWQDGWGAVPDRATATLADHTYFINWLNQQGIDWRVSLGNHDFAYQSLALWTADTGRDNYYSFDYQGYHFINLDTNYNVADTHKTVSTGDYYLGATQLAWLTSDLADNTGKKTFIFAHVPLTKHDTAAGSYVLDCNEAQAIIEASDDVVAVFTGHLHNSNFVSQNGVRYYNIEGLVDGNSVASSLYNSFAIITVANNTFTIAPSGNADNTSAWNETTFSIGQVWDSNYLVVQHFNEDPAGSAPQFIDSTVNSNNGTAEGDGANIPAQITGVIGKGLDFAGRDFNEALLFNTAGQLEADTNNASKITLEFWAKRDSLPAGVAGIETAFWHTLIYNNNTSGLGAEFHTENTDECHLAFGGRSITGDSYASNVAGEIPLNEWVYCTGVLDFTAKTVKVYANGTQLGTTLTGISWSSNTFRPATTQTKLCKIATTGVVASYRCDMMIDEFRLSNTTRDPNWIMTSYNNQSSPTTFYATETVDTNIYHTTASQYIVNGKINGALDFDGTSDYIELSSTPMYDALQNGELTVSVWLSSTDTGGAYSMLGFDAGASSGAFMVGYDEDIMIKLNFNDGSEAVEETTEWINTAHDPNWFMLTITLEQETETHYRINVYINGIRDSQASGLRRGVLANMDSSTEYIGGLSGGYYEGSLDDVGIYNRALSANEIRTIYNEANNLATNPKGFNWGWLD